MFHNMNRVKSNIIDSAISLVYFMRGSVQYSEILRLSFYERQAISSFIEKRLEVERDKMNPV